LDSATGNIVNHSPPIKKHDSNINGIAYSEKKS
jgi:hypothetical protein